MKEDLLYHIINHLSLMEETGKRIIMSIGGHHARRKQRLYRFRYLPNTKLKWLHCSRYLPLNKLKCFFHSNDTCTQNQLKQINCSFFYSP
jgi:hypothetical protein